MSQNPQEMAPQFDPKPVEERWSAFWIDNHIGRASKSPTEAKPFVLTIPPPNVTGVLHLGHAIQHSIHDCLLRYHRMKGEAALCIPGTDHAGIATQIKVEAQLRREEGMTRHDLGRPQFLARVWDWKDKYGANIIMQMKALGCSYDWERERFTMDEGYIKAVLTVFKAWFDRGLIYRGYRLVNWSSGAQTTVSDLEIEYKEVTGSLTFIKYPVEGTPDEFVTVATTRPETMLGDTAVAVHPEDARYAHLRGKNVILPLQNRPIPLVFDEAVDREFGTGAVKITPAHDPNDYETGVRHGLPMISVIGFDDNITEDGGAYAGMDKLDARKKVVEDLRALGLVEKVEPLTHSVGHCARTGVVIEPLLSEQWFVAMKELARPVADSIRMGRVSYHAPRFAQTSLEWLDNIRDWCISRQLWWGHRIPIYYGPNGEVECSVEPIEREGWHQDEDVLDTWFSSALWPFAVLGWPDDLEREWYPTSVLITGRDILNLWVSRMITTSLDFIDTDSGAPEIPFHDVLVHPTIQDALGRRMSKSLGTGIDPMDLIALYGADATRFGLLQLAGGAQDTRFVDAALLKRKSPSDTAPLEWGEADGKAIERFPQMQASRNFANKIWNASRLVLSANPTAWDGQLPDDAGARWIASRLNGTIREVTRSLESYEFDAAASALYSFIWGDFCDWFLELSKPKTRANDTGYVAFMGYVLDSALRLLHPFMPFLSEEIWSRLPRAAEDTSSLSLATWPVAGEADLEVESRFAVLQDTIRAARNLRSQAQIAPSQKVNLQLFVPVSAEAALREGEAYLTQLANVESLLFGGERSANAVSQLAGEIEVVLPLEGLIDVEKERAKLQKALETAQKDLQRVEGKLSNPNFADKAPAEVVAKEEAKRDELRAQMGTLSARLAAL
ncbi:valine--tRNA ligase [Abditibacteriota bacterium]|nr:valine--tRNA ligase [Abditibacteriota bacterium]